MCQKKDKPHIKSSTVSPPLELSLFPEEVRLIKTFQSEIERIGIRFVISESSQVSQETTILIHGVPSVFVEREVSEVKRGRPSVAVSNVKVTWIQFSLAGVKILYLKNVRSATWQTNLAAVVQRVDNSIHWVDHYPADKCWKNKLCYSLDSDLSGGLSYTPFNGARCTWW